MKAVKLSTLDRDLLAGDTVPLENKRKLLRAIDEGYFRVPFEPGDGVAIGTPVVDPTMFSFETWGPAANTGRRRTVALRALWPKTRVTLTLRYTSPVASTNAFSIGLRVRQVDTGVILTSPVNALIETATLPGPGTINSTLTTTFNAAGQLLPSMGVVCFTIVRLAPDANANDFRFIFGEYILQEVA